jgi:hypothetical protein
LASKETFLNALQSGESVTMQEAMQCRTGSVSQSVLRALRPVHLATYSSALVQTSYFPPQ